jgi:hypothetical protein
MYNITLDWVNNYFGFFSSFQFIVKHYEFVSNANPHNPAGRF